MDSDESIVWFRQHFHNKMKYPHQHSCTGIYPSLQQSAISVSIQTQPTDRPSTSRSAHYPAVSLFPITEIIGSFVGKIGRCQAQVSDYTVVAATTMLW